MNKKSEIRIILKYMTFMKIAESLGDLSYDEKHQVGAILAKKDFTNITAIGFNGNYAGGENERDSMEHGMSGYLHAEENLIGNTAHTKEVVEQYYRAFVTMTPCNMCAKRLLGKGVKEIIYLNSYLNCENSHEIFESVNATCRTLEEVIIELFDKTYLADELDELLEDSNSSLNDISDLFNKQFKSIFELDISRKKYLNDYKDYGYIIDGSDKDEIKKAYKKLFFELLYRTIKKG
jgi:deoxycytidylate deaminase